MLRPPERPARRAAFDSGASSGATLRRALPWGNCVKCLCAGAGERSQNWRFQAPRSSNAASGCAQRAPPARGGDEAGRQTPAGDRGAMRDVANDRDRHDRPGTAARGSTPYSWSTWCDCRWSAPHASACALVRRVSLRGSRPVERTDTLYPSATLIALDMPMLICSDPAQRACVPAMVGRTGQRVKATPAGGGRAVAMAPSRAMYTRRRRPSLHCRTVVERRRARCLLAQRAAASGRPSSRNAASYEACGRATSKCTQRIPARSPPRTLRSWSSTKTQSCGRRPSCSQQAA